MICNYRFRFRWQIKVSNLFFSKKMFFIFFKSKKIEISSKNLFETLTCRFRYIIIYFKIDSCLIKENFTVFFQ